MRIDPEILIAFAEEIKTLKQDLSKIVEKLRVNPAESELYAAFGQTIDRVYGTAATLGFKEIADYCRSIKEVTYKSSQSADDLGRRLTLRLMSGCLNTLDSIVTSVTDQSKLAELKSQMIKELEKSNNLQSSLFGTITRGSIT